MKTIKAVLLNNRALLVNLVSQKATYQKAVIASSVLLCLGMGQNCAPAQFSAANEPGMPTSIAGVENTAAVDSAAGYTEPTAQPLQVTYVTPEVPGLIEPSVEPFGVASSAPESSGTVQEFGGTEAAVAAVGFSEPPVQISAPPVALPTIPVVVTEVPQAPEASALVPPVFIVEQPPQEQSQQKVEEPVSQPSEPGKELVAENPPPAVDQTESTEKAQDPATEPSKKPDVAVVVPPTPVADPVETEVTALPDSEVDVCMDISKIDHNKRDRTMSRRSDDDDHDDDHADGDDDHDEHKGHEHQTVDKNDSGKGHKCSKNKSSESEKKHGHVAVIICHKGKTLTVDIQGALNGHTKHGDYLGPCGQPAVAQCKSKLEEREKKEKHHDSKGDEHHVGHNNDHDDENHSARHESAKEHRDGDGCKNSKDHDEHMKKRASSDSKKESKRS